MFNPDDFFSQSTQIGVFVVKNTNQEQQLTGQGFINPLAHQNFVENIFTTSPYGAPFPDSNLNLIPPKGLELLHK